MEHGVVKNFEEQILKKEGLAVEATREDLVIEIQEDLQ